MSDTTVDKLVVMARGHLKTTIAGTLYPLWLATKEPTIRILIVSNSEENAMKTLHDIRMVVQSPRYKTLFPDRVPDFGKVRWSDKAAELTHNRSIGPEATFEAAGIGTNIIRRHYDMIIEDDIVQMKKDDMTGEEMVPARIDIDKAIGFHRLTIPLLIDPGKSRRVHIGTRWSEQDCIDHIMRHETDGSIKRHYSVVDIPTKNPETGEPQYSRFNEDTLKAVKATMGDWLYSMLYLNTPLSASDRYFSPKHTRYFEDVDLPQDGIVRITVDPADPPTGDPNQCHTGIVAAMDSKQGLFVLETEWGRWRDTEIINRALALAKKWKATFIRVEVDRYANMEAGFDLAMEMANDYYILEPVKTRGRSKENRFRRLQPLHENGVLFLRSNMEKLENQMYQYPNGRYNDLLDALVWQVLDDYNAPLFPKPQVAKKEQPYNEFSFDQIVNSTGGSRSRYDRFFAPQDKLARRWDHGIGEGVEEQRFKNGKLKYDFSKEEEVAHGT